MTDTPADMTQSNSQAELRALAGRLASVLDQIADLQEDAKTIKAEAKLSGFNPKVFNQVVKEQRRGAEYQADQLQLELELDTYRRALDLPVTLEQAQAAVLAEAEHLPDDNAGDDVEHDSEPRAGGRPATSGRKEPEHDAYADLGAARSKRRH
jgi:uncharacterized protein (UPF0335 family)